jgi:DNA-binding response OmpR family regulator
MATVLIVETDRNQRLLLQEELEALGHAALCTATGKEAFATLSTTMPDVVILDFRPFAVDGLEFIARVNGRFPGLPIVIHSAYRPKPDSFMTRIANAWVAKQSDLTELFDTIERVLRRQRPGFPVTCISHPPGRARDPGSAATAGGVNRV